MTWACALPGQRSRRMRDSNSRGVAPNTLSNNAGQRSPGSPPSVTWSDRDGWVTADAREPRRMRPRLRPAGPPGAVGTRSTTVTAVDVDVVAMGHLPGRAEARKAGPTAAPATMPARGKLAGIRGRCSEDATPCATGLLFEHLAFFRRFCAGPYTLSALAATAVLCHVT